MSTIKLECKTLLKVIVFCLYFPLYNLSEEAKGIVSTITGYFSEISILETEKLKFDRMEKGIVTEAKIRKYKSEEPILCTLFYVCCSIKRLMLVLSKELSTDFKNDFFSLEFKLNGAVESIDFKIYTFYKYQMIDSVKVENSNQNDTMIEFTFKHDEKPDFGFLNLWGYDGSKIYLSVAEYKFEIKKYTANEKNHVVIFNNRDFFTKYEKLCIEVSTNLDHYYGLRSSYFTINGYGY
jgi:hypothetical protein